LFSAIKRFATRLPPGRWLAPTDSRCTYPRIRILELQKSGQSARAMAFGQRTWSACTPTDFRL